MLGRCRELPKSVEAPQFLGGGFGGDGRRVGFRELNADFGDEAHFPLGDDLPHEFEEPSFGGVAPGGLAGGALFAHHRPLLEIPQQHGDPAFGEREDFLEFMGGERGGAQVEQRPDPPVVALESPEFNHLPYCFDHQLFPVAHRRVIPSAKMRAHWMRFPPASVCA